MKIIWNDLFQWCEKVPFFEGRGQRLQPCRSGTLSRSKTAAGWVPHAEPSARRHPSKRWSSSFCPLIRHARRRPIPDCAYPLIRSPILPAIGSLHVDQDPVVDRLLVSIQQVVYRYAYLNDPGQDCPGTADVSAVAGSGFPASSCDALVFRRHWMGRHRLWLEKQPHPQRSQFNRLNASHSDQASISRW